MNVLVIAPHPDDETIGCGGALCEHAQKGADITAVFLTSGELGLKHLSVQKAHRIREAEARKAARILGIKHIFFLRGPDWFLGDHVRKMGRALAPILKTIQPELIYLPHPQDWHPDHKASLPILQNALQKSSLPAPELRAYEVWTPLTEPDHIVNITTFMPRKIRALRCHASQLVAFNYERAVRGLNAFRGELHAKCRFAEVFQFMKMTKNGE